MIANDPCCLTLLPLKYIELVKHLCYDIAVQNLVYGCRNTHLTSVSNNERKLTCHIQHMQQFSTMAIQSLKGSQSNPSQMAVIEQTFTHFCGMIFACTSLFCCTDHYCSICYHQKFRHRQYIDMNVTLLQDG